jgi:hypothetical protein
MKPGHVVAFGLALVLSGCFAPGSGPSPFPASSKSYTKDPDCNYNLCPAQPNSKNYRTPFERYGLRQINDDRPEEGALSIEGDLVAWTSVDKSSGHVVGHIGTYNIETHKLAAIDRESYYHDTRPVQSGGRVVFTRMPKEGAPEGPGASHLMLWDAKTNQARALDTGMNGDLESYGFDGDWISFWSSHNTNSSQDGVWLHNVDTGQTIQLFHRPTQEQFLYEGEWAPSKDSAVVDGRAYYHITKHTEPKDNVDRLLEYDIENGTTKLLYEGLEFARFSVSERYVAWEQLASVPGEQRVVVHDLEANLTWDATTADEGNAGFPHVSNDWLTYRRHLGQLPAALMALHLPTGQKVQLFDFSIFSANEAATDGHRFVVDGTRHNQVDFDLLGPDLYWGALPATPS